jgi:epsin
MSVRRNLKNVIKNYTPCERLVREATSNDPWGAPASLLANIADLTYNEIEFEQIMTLIWKRLHDHGKNWRHVYKALVLLEYCMKVGHVNVVADLQENIFAVQSLREFTYIDEAGKDCGLNVRERSKAVVALLNDSQRLIDERERAITSRERISGVAVAAQLSIRSSTSPGRPSGAPRGGGVVSGGQIYSRNSDDEVMQAAMQLSLREGPPSALS